MVTVVSHNPSLCSLQTAFTGLASLHYQTDWGGTYITRLTSTDSAMWRSRARPTAPFWQLEQRRPSGCTFKSIHVTTLSHWQPQTSAKLPGAYKLQNFTDISWMVIKLNPNASEDGCNITYGIYVFFILFYPLHKGSHQIIPSGGCWQRLVINLIIMTAIKEEI